LEQEGNFKLARWIKGPKQLILLQKALSYSPLPREFIQEKRRKKKEPDTSSAASEKNNDFCASATDTDEKEKESDTSFTSKSSEIMDAGAMETSDSSVNSNELEVSRNLYNLSKYPRFALEAVRYKVSDEAAAALANSLLRDIGYLKPDADAVNWQKIRRDQSLWHNF
jgi:hypothetical protein